jgi:peptidoglycan/LPS O-acetylase OafA/YrhL
MVALEGAVAIIVAVVLVIRALAGQDQHVTSGYGTAAWFVIMGGAVFAGGFALFRGRRWGRAIAVIAQILLIPVAYSLAFDSHRLWAGIPLMIFVVLTLGLLFSPSSLRWLSAAYAPDARPAPDADDDGESGDGDRQRPE